MSASQPAVLNAPTRSRPPGPPPGLALALVAGDRLALAGLVHLLSRDRTLRLVRAVRDLAALTDSGNVPRIDVVVLYDRGGQFPAEASGAAPGRRLLVVSAADALPCPLAIIQAGADGVVSSASSGIELRRAVHTVGAGGVYIGGGLAAGVKGRLSDMLTRPRPDRQVPKLAPREAETLRLIADGLTHAEAASRMSVTPGTVNTYAKRLRIKLLAANKAQLARRAVELGYVPRRASAVPRWAG